MTDRQYGPGGWAGGVFSTDPDTERITVSDHDYQEPAHAADPDWSGERYAADNAYAEAHARWRAANCDTSTFLTGTPAPVAAAPAAVPWTWLDTYLRRAVMIGAAVLIWTAIVMGILLMAGSGYILSRVGDTTQSTVDDPSLYNTDEPLIPREPECLGEAPC